MSFFESLYANFLLNWNNYVAPIFLSIFQYSLYFLKMLLNLLSQSTHSARHKCVLDLPKALTTLKICSVFLPFKHFIGEAVEGIVTGIKKRKRKNGDILDTNDTN